MNQPYSSHSRFIWMGIALGAVFWMLEAAVHVLVFHDVGFFEQVFSPEPHEVWMRLTIVTIYILSIETLYSLRYFIFKFLSSDLPK